MSNSLNTANHHIAFDALTAMKQAVFICDDVDSLTLTLAAGESDWVNKIMPHAQLGQAFTLTDESYFLQDFLIDAKNVWQNNSNGKLSSGFWTEEYNVDNKKYLHLEAIAVNNNNLHLLIIINQSEAFVHKQNTLQAAREMMLANDKLQEQYDYLQHRLLTLLNTPDSIDDLLSPILSAIENANFGVIVVDANFKSLIDNPAVLKIFDHVDVHTHTIQSPVNIILNLMESQLPEYERITEMGSSWSGELCWMKPPNTLKWLKVAIYPAKDSYNNIKHWILFINDISREKYLLQRNEKLTQQDLLTNLPNRYAFWQYLEQSIAAQSSFLLLYIDIKNFKQINEFYGHGEGDKLLFEFSLRCKGLLKSNDFIARIGGDEFAIVFQQTNSVEEGRLLGNHLFSAAHLSFYTQAGEAYNIDISVGGTFSPYDSSSPEELVKFADFSAYNGSFNQKSGIQFYSQKMQEDSSKRIGFENGLRKAIVNNEFSLVFQPILNLKSQTIEKAEVLIRWERPGYGMVMPSDFIDIAEQSGFIVDLGKWVFDAAVKYLKQLELQGMAIKLSINLSPLQVQDNALLSFIKNSVKVAKVDPALIEVEITEGSLISDFDEMYKLLTLLRDLGLSVAIDDFGTGYSSLAYLKKLPIDSLKIDRSFIHDIVTDNNDKAIVKAIIAMAHQLRLSVVAEGVETKEQQSFLSENNCDSAQGYLFSRPLAFDKLVEHLKK